MLGTSPGSPRRIFGPLAKEKQKHALWGELGLTAPPEQVVVEDNYRLKSPACYEYVGLLH